MCMTQLEKNLAFWLILTENKIPITVKISICFLSPIAFKTYQSQYGNKHSFRFTQRFVEGKNFEFSAISNFFAVPWEITDVHCSLKATLECVLWLGVWLCNLARAPTSYFNHFQIWWGHGWIFCLQNGVRFSSVLLLLPFYEAFSTAVKNKERGEKHKSKLQ